MEIDTRSGSAAGPDHDPILDAKMSSLFALGQPEIAGLRKHVDDIIDALCESPETAEDNVRTSLRLAGRTPNIAKFAFRSYPAFDGKIFNDTKAKQARDGLLKAGLESGLASATTTSQRSGNDTPDLSLRVIYTPRSSSTRFAKVYRTVEVKAPPHTRVTSKYALVPDQDALEAHFIGGLSQAVMYAYAQWEMYGLGVSMFVCAPFFSRLIIDRTGTVAFIEVETVLDKDRGNRDVTPSSARDTATASTVPEHPPLAPREIFKKYRSDSMPHSFINKDATGVDDGAIETYLSFHVDGVTEISGKTVREAIDNRPSPEASISESTRQPWLESTVEVSAEQDLDKWARLKETRRKPKPKPKPKPSNKRSRPGDEDQDEGRSDPGQGAGGDDGGHGGDQGGGGPARRPGDRGPGGQGDDHQRDNPGREPPPGTQGHGDHIQAPISTQKTHPAQTRGKCSTIDEWRAQVTRTEVLDDQTTTISPSVGQGVSAESGPHLEVQDDPSRPKEVGILDLELPLGVDSESYAGSGAKLQRLVNLGIGLVPVTTGEMELLLREQS